MDKDSVEHFMTKMSQKEFDERKGSNPIEPYSFNRIQPDSSKREDSSCFWCDKFATLHLTTSVDVEGNPVKLCEKCKRADDEASKEIELMRCSEHGSNIVREVP
jgi:hypothetical protein